MECTGFLVAHAQSELEAYELKQALYTESNLSHPKSARSASDQLKERTLRDKLALAKRIAVKAQKNYDETVDGPPRSTE